MQARLKIAASETINFYRNATSSMRVLPDFLILGVQKGGTTSLYNYLIEHPNIIRARRKEAHFFDQHFEKGISWYRGNFPTFMSKYYIEKIRKQVFITGEGSPEYLFYPHIAKKVGNLLPKAKLIVLLRNPVDRAYSQYRHNIRWGHETLSFEDALALEEERTKEGKERAAKEENYHNFSYQRAAYIARGIYVDQVHRWLSIFPREQLLVLRSEDFFKEPGEMYKKTLSFLNVPVFEPKSLQAGYKQYNKSKDSDAPRKMDSAIRKRLIAYFEPYNTRLYELLGMDLGWDN
jgi:hypothetical protein